MEVWNGITRYFDIFKRGKVKRRMESLGKMVSIMKIGIFILWYFGYHKIVLMEHNLRLKNGIIMKAKSFKIW